MRADTELAALIERLEAATGPSRELDAAIAALCDPTDDPRLAAFGSGDDYPRNYTRSIDAAMSLVPEGLDHFRLYRLLGQWHAEIGLWYWPAASDEPGQLQEWHEGQSNAPALALCIASLRARMAAPSPTPTTGA